MATVPKTTTAGVTAHAAPNPKRWWILALICLSITVNYFDRTLIGILRPVIDADISLTDQIYGRITAVFFLAYGLGSLLCGRILDRFGTRIGLGIATVVWSISAMLHGTVANAGWFMAWRFGLGAGEGAGFPAANKATAEWFPPQERATAAGIFTATTNIANVIGPLLFVFMVQGLGFSWRTCFYIIGGLGFLWLIPWATSYKLPAQTEPSSAAVKPAAGITMLEVMRYKQAWGYGIGKFLTDCTWFFFVFWLPSYFTNVLGRNLSSMAIGMSSIMLISAAGAVIAGWGTGVLIKRGMRPGQARKRMMLICALLMLPSGMAVMVTDLYAVILLFALAATAHQAWMANLFTTTADVFPARAVGVTNGFGGALGAAGAFLGTGIIPGELIPVYGYAPIFLAMVSLYLVAWSAVHFLMGDLEPIELLKG